MNSIEYCLQEVRNHLREMQDGVIAICGEPKIINEVIKKCPNLDIKYIADDVLRGTYIDDYCVIGYDDIFKLEIKYVLIADYIEKVDQIYRKIYRECKYNGISIFNLMGKNLQDCYKLALKSEIDYPKLNKESLFEEIDKNDVISFDLGNTLFTVKHLYYSDFYRAVGKQINNEGIDIFDFMQRVENIKKRDRFSNLRVILEVMIKEENFPQDYLERIWKIILDEVKVEFVPRKSVLEALKYAKRKGKKVCIIEDMLEYRLPGIVWKLLLESYGIQVDEILSSSDYWSYKDGLYCEMLEKYGENRSYLHVGDDIDDDLIKAMNYGFNSFLIKSPLELMKRVDDFVLELIENNIVRDLIEKYIIEVYSESYLVSEIREKKKSNCVVEKRNNIKAQIDFWKNCNSILECEPIQYEPVLFQTNADEFGKEDFEILKFKENENPKVSIIIPVYNQFDYTYNCLKSILIHSGEIEYEVIVADDSSTDRVKELEQFVTGITVVHNTENLKFLKNCNNASKLARGEYILFLNNDTQVQPNWLEPLTSLMDRDAEIGMVGSKLIYPNGQLQEAGGILWKDGSAWNYGHFMNPESAEYSYVKEVDYISGAAIMIRKNLWNVIGGFDEQFMPAYYEDTDLAFEVRRQGYKVCLQPQSIVVHFEGVSNGTDIQSGIKIFQLKNREKFYFKWKDILNKEHFENGENVFLAKDRGQTKKRILVVDHYVPNYDRDAGGRCTFMYLKLFKQLGLQVTFIGDNFAKPEPYTTELTQMGVEVLYGDFYYLHWKEWLQLNAKYFDFVYLQRPHISKKYIDIIKRYSSAKIFYFAHDLHFLRTYRDYLISGDENSLKESEEWKPIEMDLFAKADVGHVVGCYEQELIQKEFPDKPIRNIPLYIYDNILKDIPKDFSKRKGILFVGGFNHKPNIDAVLWFGKEIFPKLLEKYPDLVWYIVGSNAPEEVRKLENTNIILKGYICDSELESLYKKCRIAVVPLRYGAGVKGKIVEAAFYQIPVVTTTIGGEGLDSSVGAFVMEDDAMKMKDLICAMYEDYERLQQMSDCGKSMIQKYFTIEAASNILKKDLTLDLVKL